jgi:hypothetical protein
MVTQKRALKWLTEGSERAFPMIGPLALDLLLHGNPIEASIHPKLTGIPGAMEYPPGFLLLPLRSSTLPPFKTTTLVTYAPASAYRLESAKIQIIEAADEKPGAPLETEPLAASSKDADVEAGAEVASGSTQGRETGGAMQSASQSRPPPPTKPKQAASRSEIEEVLSGSGAGSSGRGNFDPLRKLPSAAREKRAKEAEKRRQEKAESLRSAGEKQQEGARIRGTCLLVDPGGHTDMEGRAQVSIFFGLVSACLSWVMLMINVLSGCIGWPFGGCSCHQGPLTPALLRLPLLNTENKELIQASESTQK